MGLLGAMQGLGQGMANIGQMGVQATIKAQAEAAEAERAARIAEYKESRGDARALNSEIAKRELDRGRYATETDETGTTYNVDTLSGKRDVLRKPERDGSLKQIMTPDGPRWARADDAVGQPPVTQYGTSITLPDGTVMQMGGSPGGGKAPAGYRWRDERNPQVGLEPIPGGPADELSPGDAAKASLIEQGRTDAREAASVIIGPDGKVDRIALAQMETRAPFTKGRSLRSLIYNSVEGKLRAESGAAVPEPEVKRIAERFIPSMLDDDATVKMKLQRLDEYLGATLNKMDPTSRFESRAPQQPAPVNLQHVSDEDLLRVLGVQR